MMKFSTDKRFFGCDWYRWCRAKIVSPFLGIMILKIVLQSILLNSDEENCILWFSFLQMIYTGLFSEVFLS